MRFIRMAVLEGCTASAGGDVEKLDASCARARGNVEQSRGGGIAPPPKTLEVGLPRDPAHPLLGGHSVAESRQWDRRLHPRVHSSAARGSWNAGTSEALPDGRTAKPAGGFPYNGCCLSVSGKETRTRATAWVNLEDITLSETNQSPKDKSYRILFSQGPWSHQIHRNRQ